MFKNNKILVTGADGFIGSHLTEMLLKKGNKVWALSYYNSFNSWGWLEDVEKSKNLEIVSGDIRDAHLCKKITEDIDVVYHLAALIAIPYSYIAPDSYVDTNVRGTLNICQSALENKCKRIVVTSTSEVYGTAQYVPIDERHPLQPQSPYSASKIGADAIAMSFYNSFNLPLTLARPFNTFGPRQSARAVIPSIIIQIANGAKKIKIGDVSPKRDFTYVKDVCSGFIHLAESAKTIGEIVNIGSSTEVSVEETFNIIKKLMKSDSELVVDKKRIRPEKSEVFRLCCDTSKIKNLTEFSPKYSFEKGLKKTIDWFSQSTNLAKYKPAIYNV